MKALETIRTAVTLTLALTVATWILATDKAERMQYNRDLGITEEEC